VCTIEWITPVHDGPVKVLAKSPFLPNLLLSVGGYSFAVWNEGVMVRSIFYKAWGNVIGPGLPDFSGSKQTKTGKINQMATYYTKQP
jgi:hypothetical protein